MITPGNRFYEKSVTEQVVAIILGGGRGSRLYPLTRERAKPAVPLAGRYRLIDIPLSNCINSMINRIFVVTQFNSRSLHRHINETYRFDLFSKGFVEVLAAEQTVNRGDWFQGTSDAIRQNFWHFRSADSEHFLILSGDHLYRMDYRDFIARHIRSGADITISMLPVNEEAAKGFGIMKVERDGRITEFVEKPQTPEQLANIKTPPNVLVDYGFDTSSGREYLASMGVYLFKRDVLEQLLTTHPEWIDFGKHVIPEALKTHRVHAYLFNGFWEDIGTVQSFYDVSMRLLDPDPPFDFLDPGHLIYSRARYLPGARIRQADIENSFICEGSQIEGASLRHSIVGIRSNIRQNVHIEQSIVMGADYYDLDNQEHEMPLGIGSGTSIERAIIDKNARIGRNVHIRGSVGREDYIGEDYAIVDGIAIVLKNAVIPDNTVIE